MKEDGDPRRAEGREDGRGCGRPAQRGQRARRPGSAGEVDGAARLSPLSSPRGAAGAERVAAPPPAHPARGRFQKTSVGVVGGEAGAAAARARAPRAGVLAGGRAGLRGPAAGARAPHCSGQHVRGGPEDAGRALRRQGDSLPAKYSARWRRRPLFGLGGKKKAGKRGGSGRGRGVGLPFKGAGGSR